MIRRDRLLGAASLAFAAGYVFVAGAFGEFLRPSASDNPVYIAGRFSGALFAASGFAAIGIALAGKRSRRSRGIRIGAYIILAGYSIQTLISLLTHSEHTVRTIASVVGLVPFLFLAHAFKPSDGGETPRTVKTRHRSLGSAAEWLALFAGLTVLGGLLTLPSFEQSESTRLAQWTIALLSDVVLTACFVLAALAFRSVSRSGSTSDAPPVYDLGHWALAERDRLLSRSASLFALAGVLSVVASALVLRQFSSSGAGLPSLTYAWLVTLSDLRFVLAGLLGTIAFAHTRNGHKDRGYA